MGLMLFPGIADFDKRLISICKSSVGAWRWENWWTNKHVTAKEAYLILERRLKEYGPQSEQHFCGKVS